MQRAKRTLQTPSSAGKAKTPTPSGKPHWQRVGFDDVRTKDPEYIRNNHANAGVKLCDQRLQLTDDVARIAGYARGTVSSVLCDYVYEANRRDCLHHCAAYALERRIGISEEAVLRILSVFFMLRDYLPQYATDYQEALAHEAAFCMSLHDLPPPSAEETA